MTTNPTVSRGLDAQDAAGAAHKAAALAAQGVVAVVGYYFHFSAYKTLLSKAAAQMLAAAGLSVISVYESGNPTSADYFGAESGNADTDAHTAASRAAAAGQPAGTPIYFAVDYDADRSDLAAIASYFAEVRRLLQLLPGGYTCGVYASGLVCQYLSQLGLVSHTWLSQSKGFSLYTVWLPSANIVQGVETTDLALDVDLDTVRGAAADYGGWVPG